MISNSKNQIIKKKFEIDLKSYLAIKKIFEDSEKKTMKIVWLMFLVLFLFLFVKPYITNSSKEIKNVNVGWTKSCHHRVVSNY